MSVADIASEFEKMGGVFTTSPVLLSSRLKAVKALVFDWDGVWHDGRKDGTGKSSFSEVDSMGLNLLRFGFYLQNKEIPRTFIITGENNVTAFDFAAREHLDGVFFKAKNKLEFFTYILNQWQLKPEEVLFVFDDVLDLAMAAQCGVKYFVSRTGSPLLNRFVEAQNLSDYQTANDGGNHAVREICELSLGLLGLYDEVVDGRMAFSESYTAYWDTRNTKQVRYFTKIQENIRETSV
jgi:3-deoxy-D-manno-octulosonate 8-phosphate phosphatase (KDO 8-P phosphatase)